MPPMEPTGNRLEKLLRIPYVDPEYGFDISLDGTRLAFAWNQSGTWEIYELAIDRRNPLRQITSGPGAKFGPKYAPDGKRLAYVLDADGSEAFDIWMYEPPKSQDGHPRHTNLTPGTTYAIQPHICWSPAGDEIAFISDQSNTFDTYIMPAAGGEARPVYGSAHPDWEVLWSPDGRKLAVISESSGQDYALTVIHLDRGDSNTVCLDGQPANITSACWSPESQQLAISCRTGEFFQIGIFDISTEQVRWLTDGEGDKLSPDWSADDAQIGFIHSHGPDSALMVFDLATRDIHSWQVAPGVHYCPKFSPNRAQVAFIFGNSQQPEDIWLLDLTSRASTQLTHSLPGEFRPNNFALPKAVTYPSLDGTPVPALLFLPDNSSHKPPAVVVVHGGPNWLFQYLWYPIFQEMVRRGWAVLLPNYRGSTGYGRSWQLSNRFEMGCLDTMDVVAGADYLVREGLADPEKIAITGRSHGGYLTMTSMTEYPDRWAAGSAVVPFLNWFTSHANSRKDLQHWDIENMGSPDENYDLWYTRSPYFHLERIQAPVQLICGANDPRCPASESTAARDVLQSLGKSVDYMLYPDEGHAFLKIENIIDAELRRLDFLAKYL